MDLWRRAPAPLRRCLVRLTQRTYAVGVIGLVPNLNNQVLLLRHRFRVPFEWGVPGGFIDGMETPEAALAREVREEVGFEVAVCPGVFMHELNHATAFVTYFVVAERTQRVPERLNHHEIVEWRFSGPDALPAKLQPSHRSVLDRYWSSGNGPADNLVVVP